MFSEYASKFLAQSQSRLSSFAGQTDNNSPTDRPTRRQPDWSSRGSRLGAGRTYLGRGASNNPYQSGASRFGNLNTLGSRYATQDAPLFQAALEADEEDEDERDREQADYYALKRSRRAFGPTHMEESAETDGDDGSQVSGDSGSRELRPSFGERARGIRSSWNGTRAFYRRDQQQGNGKGKEPAVREADADTPRQSSEANDDTKGRMVDVGLESTIADDSEPPPDLITMQLTEEDEEEEEEEDLDSPPLHKFREPNTPVNPSSARFQARRSSAVDSELGLHPPSSADTNAHANAAAATAVPVSDGDMFRHDTFFAWLYLIAQASLLATFVLVFLHTSGKRPMGDTIYTTLRASFNMLAVDTLVSIVVSLVWLAALRSFVRPLVYLIMLAVPVIFTSFALYPFISSYQSAGGSSRLLLQDTVMRWAALIPAISAVVWVYMVLKGRHALQSAIDILDFSSRILAANSALLLVGMGCLAVVVLWTWAWLLMFTRVFLGGSFSNPLSRFIISASTWWLGVYFVLMYIWTLSIIAGVQRGTTAATVSQWYFHRNAVPVPSSQEVVQAALNHALTTIFGTVSLSTLLALGIRLPLLVLPQRAASLLGLFAYSFVPTPIAAMTNPLTLTYAAIHSQNLAMSARGLSQMDFLGPQGPTTTLTPAAFQRRNGNLRSSSPLLPYRLAKLILHATRFIMATGLGFAGWVITARQLTVGAPDGGSGDGVGSSLRGSAYAYVVGLVASFIGWGILGAMEGVLSGIVDAVVICYGSEKRMLVGAHGGYCMEAAMLFGGGSRGPGRDDGRETDEYY